ncbi:MAG: helix-turn-helix domain-containing protein [Acidimicrobiales bacterium]
MTNHQANPTTEPPLLFAIHEAADLLGIGRTNVYVLMNNGKLHSVKIGGRRLIPRVSLERFVNELLEAS